ncbi:PREDICTED: uncharacterized protein LOC109471342 [Branchiostoma belcheri]|uniref:Uncharacterized protein LOC109471342 n=1 Tax=Branchiostoma belcheri TaxID=7741 RepID=A0A6P4YWS5_BRABE|nr:PREDICTED: uncharacterized protein LOC109471342 [Branchiostoma belcheri]
MDNAAVLLLSELYGTLKGGISSIYRRLAQVLREHEPDIPVFSTVLEATEEDKKDAKSDGVRELLLPQVESGDERTKPSLHWLTFDHRAKYPHLPEKVKTIVGHTDGTSRAACGIKQDRCPEATAILFIDDIPEETEQYKGDEKALGIGKKEDSILKDAEQADVVFSIGDRIFDHFKNQFRAIPASKQPQHIKFVPRPSSIFEDADAEYKDTDTMVVLSISRVTGVEKLNGLDLAVKALSIVAEKMSVTLRVRGVNKEDQKARNAILGHRNSTNLQITFDPYGTQEDILKDMLQAHLVLVPSCAEPFGFVGLQAIAAGVPVLVSDKSGLANLIEKFARRYHNCIVKTDIHGNGKMNFNVSRWADRIEKVLEHCKEEFETAANLKKDLLDTRYWEESERTFIEICKRKGPPSAVFGDQGTQDNGDSYESGSDDDSSNFIILEISNKIFNEEVLQDPQMFESKFSVFRRHFVASYPHFKRLSCKAKLRVKKIVANQITKFNKVLLSSQRLESMYEKMVECFEKFSAILTKIEDGCVLCTLEFDDTPHLKSFLRGYRDGLLSETLTQELITEDMKQEEGPGLFVDVTLLVARDTAEVDDDGPNKNISRSLCDLHATKTQRSTLQPGLVSLNLATTIAQDSRFKDWESDPLINQLALGLAVKSRQAQESDRKAKRTIEILHTDVHKLTQEIETTAKMLADQNKELQRQQEANTRLTRTIEDLRAQKTSRAPTLEREEIRQAVEKADVDVYARDQRRKRLKLEESAFQTSEEEATTDTRQESLKAEAEDGRTTPHEASGHGETGVVELPRHGADVQARDKNDDETALLEASRRGDTGEVELLIQHGTDVQARDNVSTDSHLV